MGMNNNFSESNVVDFEQFSSLYIKKYGVPTVLDKPVDNSDSSVVFEDKVFSERVNTLPPRLQAMFKIVGLLALKICVLFIKIVSSGTFWFGVVPAFVLTCYSFFVDKTVFYTVVFSTVAIFTVGLGVLLLNFFANIGNKS